MSICNKKETIDAYEEMKREAEQIEDSDAKLIFISKHLNKCSMAELRIIAEHAASQKGVW